MRELFIYYQIPVTQAVAARAQVDAFQARLRQRHPGLVTRLLRAIGQLWTCRHCFG